MGRMILRDDQWDRIKDLLPGKSSYCGVTAADNRLFLEAVLWIARTGSLWRNLPTNFGHWHRVYVRYNRWAHKGHWVRIFEARVGSGEERTASIQTVPYKPIKAFPFKATRDHGTYIWKAIYRIDISRVSLP